ncbi:hypothetical protein [Nocardia brasiliensis]|uniref:hypothetical protein n=1 Tax=Nocardia brasiliensis TaxID=37326 RepID=UPI003D8DD774
MAVRRSALPPGCLNLQNRHDTADELLPEMIAARSVIEQAKGIIMRMYRIDAG